MTVDKEAFEYAIAKIDDGNIFEVFCLEFLASILGHSFIPVAGTKDKGVDGFQHFFTREGKEKQIFQITTEKDIEGKLNSTLVKLKDNEILLDKLVYVTNRKVNNSDRIIDEIYNNQGIHIVIYDIRWFKTNCNISPQSIKSYQIFVDTYLHEYTKPGHSSTVADFEIDSRLFVFLGQQFNNNRVDLKLDDLLADTLILYALEESSPENLINEDVIKLSIKKYLKFDPQLLDEKISTRLKKLASKPKKINHHTKEDGYCLPYDTRQELLERNLKDEKLHQDFFTETHVTIKKFFKEIDVRVHDIQGLITKVFNDIFSKQGLEFSNFVLEGDSDSVIEQNLNDVISSAVDDSKIVLGNKEKVKTALHLAIRDIVYNGSVTQIKFLKSLSNTYLMMFLLQWEPKLSTYFQTLSSKLVVFVDNSIIVPALSEYFLKEGNRRHWNLLVGSKKAGISMFINDSLLNELVSHLKMIRNKYYSNFRDLEEFYLNDDFELLFIDEILIRAFFYAKKEGKINTFDDFLETFVDSQLQNTKEELIVYLNDIFGIKYISNEMWNIQINEDEKAKLSEVLSEKKANIKAENDAEMILAIYHLRNKSGESSDTGIFGYKTWWLSKDTSTYKAVVESFGNEKYPVSCYIRPDFIYNYIALKPSSEEVKGAFEEIFPTMLGVNLSYHMPREVSQVVQSKIKEFHLKPAVRVKQTLKVLSDRLKSDPTLKNRNSVEHFLDIELSKLKDVEL